MENIRQAIERAKVQAGGGIAGPRSERPDISRNVDTSRNADYSVSSPHDHHATQKPHEIELNRGYLMANRIIAHGKPKPLSRPFDMLRTQVLQTMDEKNYKVIGVTSPTPGCGKTVTAVNLALSIGRQEENSVLLVDLDFQRPRVATTLGLNSEVGALSVLEGRATLSETVIHTRIDHQQLMVIPTHQSWASSELMASQAMTAFVEDLRREFVSSTIMVDLPPILSSDDVIAILPEIDCLLLVVAAGTTKPSDVEDCVRHLKTADVLRVVVNKSTEGNSSHYYY